jgi:hypothetical protein
MPEVDGRAEACSAVIRLLRRNAAESHKVTAAGYRLLASTKRNCARVLKVFRKQMALAEARRRRRERRKAQRLARQQRR